MKLLAVTFLFAVAITLVRAQDKPRRCENSNDCEEGECCLAKGLMIHRQGVCAPKEKVGKRCVDERMEVMGKFILRCPCAAGLICQPTGFVEYRNVTMGINERCSDGTTTQPEEYTTIENTTD
ncbi:hypothetical protein JTE90_013711 [Oedothorax gibbosus]|uniref:Prokineticin domain-containing protein n=1 Tax=Oedothorax gibbosus TaxID=931172 RepID=A0AAV6UXQ3_9ARAC|nr:hypothetical protein JTE90_013711 [Oedothorax gibbosus]